MSNIANIEKAVLSSIIFDPASFEDVAEDGNDILSYRLHAIGQHIGSSIKFDRTVLGAVNENFEIISVRGKMPTIYSKSQENYSKINQWRKFLLDFATDKRLIIVDTFRRFHDGDENSSGDMSEVIKFFEHVANETGCAILLSHHTNKAGGNGNNNDEQTSARGSSAIIDNARFQIAIAKMSKEQAKEYDIPEAERSFYVQVDIPKANYTKPIGKKWLKRIGGGVLEEVVLEKERIKNGY